MTLISSANSQTNRLVLALRERILNGEFTPGERLTELGLVSLLQASRTPVRLALERLAHEGLVDVIPSGGFRLRAFSHSDIRDAIEIRGVLEGTAARFAAERLGSPKDLRRAKELIQETSLEAPITLDGFAEYLEMNRAFHRELWTLAKSPLLYRELEHACKIPFAAPEALVFSLAEHERSTAVVAMEQHRAIVESIENREGARAEALAREHSRISRRNLEHVFENAETSRRLPGAALIVIF